jgi:hypothetical protein
MSIGVLKRIDRHPLRGFVRSSQLNEGTVPFSTGCQDGKVQNQQFENKNAGR